MVASDGGIFAFGDAQFSGSGTGGSLTAPAVGIAARPGGYWIAYGQTADWNTPLGQQELLAGLGYLPLSWSAQLGFNWRWPTVPPAAGGALVAGHRQPGPRGRHLGLRGGGGAAHGRPDLPR